MKTPVLIGFFYFFALTVVWSQIMQPPPRDSFDVIVVFPEGTSFKAIEGRKNSLGAKEKWITPITKARLWRMPNSRTVKSGDPADWFPYSSPTEAVERARRKTSGVEFFIEENVEITIPESPNMWLSRPSASCVTLDIKRFVVPPNKNGRPGKIAILDTGLGCNSRIPDCKIPPELNSLIAFGEGYNFTNDYPSVKIFGDNHGHGMAVASLIAPNMGNAANIVPIKVLDRHAKGRMYALIQGIDHAIQTNVDIINISIVAEVRPNSDGKYFPLDKTPLGIAMGMAQRNDILVVCAAGNNQRIIDDKPLLPACVPADNILVVGAESCIGSIASFSNVGLIHVDIFAPGENIIVPTVEGLTRPVSGTSFATPIVAGIAFALRTHSGTRSWQQLKCAIMQGAYRTKGSVFVGKCVSGGTIDNTAALGRLSYCFRK
ncbi:MAG: S8 family serine peptidase [Haliscomenobacter sp.]|uniref:S8 family peptidase n=1 Tax=Haliscomenobacter sp. TaxID=2717303 RepID=UPI0029A2E785|nr:S8 family serine peptidase [Haliscomenobacter sp.]MDX2068424.1 S8 family serine peptidase [Haliscomenobacter sp.]